MYTHEHTHTLNLEANLEAQAWHKNTRTALTCALMHTNITKTHTHMQLHIEAQV